MTNSHIRHEANKKKQELIDALNEVNNLCQVNIDMLTGVEGYSGENCYDPQRIFDAAVQAYIEWRTVQNIVEQAG